jgi:hypothetical protein
MIIMEISKELADAINDQITFELYSGYIYLSMAFTMPITQGWHTGWKSKQMRNMLMRYVSIDML